MKFLLDTHALLWFLEGSEQLSSRARTLIEDASHHKLVSAASFWEIAIKVSIGKLDIDMSLEQLAVLATESGCDFLPGYPEHTYSLRTLPYHHKDPFDRLLLAQAMVEEAHIISKDEILICM